MDNYECDDGMDVMITHNGCNFGYDDGCGNGCD